MEDKILVKAIREFNDKYKGKVDTKTEAWYVSKERFDLLTNKVKNPYNEKLVEKVEGNELEEVKAEKVEDNELEEVKVEKVEDNELDEAKVEKPKRKR